MNNASPVMDATTALLEWAEKYLRYKDSMARSILQMKRDGNKILVEKKNVTRVAVVLPALADKPAEADIIITLSNTDNINTLVRHWKKFSEKQKLTIIFANPLSEEENKWVVQPFIHTRICEEKALKKGFLGMAELVPPVTEADF
jgi:hypothetical protein